MTGTRERSATDPPRCYVASPLGFTEGGRFYYERVLLPVLRRHVEVVDPWDLPGAETLPPQSRPQERAAEIGRRNAAAIQGCTSLVAILEGQEVDSGTAAEIGYAAARGITCMGLRTDIRESGEPGATVNLQVEAFIRLSGGRIVDSLDALEEAVRR